MSWNMIRSATAFLSTFPLRGTSAFWGVPEGRTPISIHVPLAGNVIKRAARACRLPQFLSTFPLRGTSYEPAPVYFKAVISIHVPLAGNVDYSALDVRAPGEISIHVPLAGNVLQCPEKGAYTAYISIHVPLAGNVGSLLSPGYAPSHFYPRSPCGERQRWAHYCKDIGHISIHVPLAGNVME